MPAIQSAAAQNEFAKMYKALQAFEQDNDGVDLTGSKSSTGLVAFVHLQGRRLYMLSYDTDRSGYVMFTPRKACTFVKGRFDTLIYQLKRNLLH